MSELEANPLKCDKGIKQSTEYLECLAMLKGGPLLVFIGDLNRLHITTPINICIHHGPSNICSYPMLRFKIKIDCQLCLFCLM